MVGVFFTEYGGRSCVWIFLVYAGTVYISVPVEGISSSPWAAKITKKFYEKLRKSKGSQYRCLSSRFAHTERRLEIRSWSCCRLITRGRRQHLGVCNEAIQAEPAIRARPVPSRSPRYRSPIRESSTDEMIVTSALLNLRPVAQSI